MNRKKIFVFIVLMFFVSSIADITKKTDVRDVYLYLQNANSFTGKVVYVYDGDTVKVTRDDTGDEEKIRLLGVNTPEERVYENGQWVDQPEPYAEKAFDYTMNALKDKTVTVYFAADENYQRDHYGRLLGVIYINGRIHNVDLLREGLAKRYFYNANPIMNFENWVKAEATARKRRKNMWSDVYKNRIVITEVYPDPPGNETDTGKEFIELKNAGDKAVNLKDWMFMFDKMTYYNKFTSNDFTLNPGEICVISTVDESTFRSLFPSMPQNAKYLKSENSFWFTNNPNPTEQRIFYIVTPDKLLEDAITFNLDWYNGLRNEGKSLQKKSDKLRELESGIVTANSNDKTLFKADTPTPGAM